MTPFWWACCTAWQTGMNSSSRCRGVRRCSSQYLVIGTPLTRSITKYGRPPPQAPPSQGGEPVLSPPCEGGAWGGGRAAVQDFGDIRVVHQGQGLALGLEAGDDLLRVHPGLDELERHHALDRLGLLSHPHRAHAPFADLLDELVRAEDGAGSFHCRPCVGGRRR